MSNPNVPPPIRKGRGCMFYGCLTCIVLLLLLCFAGFLALRFVKNKIASYTDSAPMELPKVEMADADFKRLQERVKNFGDAMDRGEPVEPLTLNELEINALIAKSDNAKDIADKVHVSLNDNEVKGQVSIPLSGLGWIGKGRYLNGEATFNVSLENGVLIVTANEVLVKGKPLPDSFMKSFRKENLAKDAYKDPKNAAALRKIESIRIQDGRVIVAPRTATQTQPQAFLPMWRSYSSITYRSVMPAM